MLHFDQSHSKDNPPVDLGYAPYTGATPLKPKLYWQYLGFYFDCKLTFTEHVQYYSTKALSTVKAMMMLGSSTRVMYSFHLWYFAAACCKGALHHLSVMQHSAALWITGAFRTSPTGGVEALVGLPPINLLLRRLSEQADYWFATLTPTHPTMSEPEIFHTSRTLFESDTNVLALTETLLPMNPLSRPVISRGNADKELKQHTKHLNKLRDKISENIGTYYAGTDVSLPLSGRYQAIAASSLFSGGAEHWHAQHVAGKVTVPDAELYAIHSAIINATLHDDCMNIFIFMDSMASAC
ncbi:hypothetical protein CVT25_005251 [Psilocybe cyanescens]|uniref:RNase H type-1 domain-containing protein n=1 Tax=Psilocybe cyanescens TaxID=93625 RepID=A0A409XML9_PSICY|nr:hypothetical protein CVT25_005251 [Psilocybe cyanescens]